MKITIKAFVAPKDGELYGDCADRYGISRVTSSLAIADGVSMAYMPHLWAELLVKKYVEKPEQFYSVSESNGIKLSSDVYNLWNSKLKLEEGKLSAEQKFITELKKEKVNYAASTFIGVTLTNRVWEYYTIGDSVLFYYDIYTKELQKYTSLEVFGNNPEYLASNGKDRGKVEKGSIAVEEGYLLLMTDALSEWLISNFEEDEKKVLDLLELKTHEAFCDFIASLRSDKKLRSDDVCIVIAKVDDVQTEEYIWNEENLDDLETFSQKDREFKLKEDQARLEEKNQGLKNDLIEIKKESENFKKSNNYLRLELDSFKEECGRLRSEKTQEEENVKKLKNQLREISKKYSDLLKELEEIVNTLKSDRGLLDRFLGKIKRGLINIEKFGLNWKTDKKYYQPEDSNNWGAELKSLNQDNDDYGDDQENENKDISGSDKDCPDLNSYLECYLKSCGKDKFDKEIIEVFEAINASYSPGFRKSSYKTNEMYALISPIGDIYKEEYKEAVGSYLSYLYKCAHLEYFAYFIGNKYNIIELKSEGYGTSDN